MNSSSISTDALIWRSFWLDPLFHAGERLERGLLGHRRHRLGDALLRLGAALAGEEQVLLALRLLDLVVEVAQRVLELLGLGAVRFPRLLELLPVRGVLALAHERLLGEVVAAFLDREHRRFCSQSAACLILGVGLVAQTLLVGDGGGDLLLRLRRAGRACRRGSAFSIFSGSSAQEIRSLMFDLSSVEKRSKIPMVSVPRGSEPSSRRCEASARVMLSYAARNSS